MVRVGEREGEKHQCMCGCLLRPPHYPTGDLACNPDMCPDLELNQWSFGLQSGAQSTETHQPGQVSTDWSMTGQRVFNHCSWSWTCPSGFVAFLGLERKYKWGLDVISVLGHCVQSHSLIVWLSVSGFLFYLTKNFPSFLLSCLNTMA